MTPSSDNERFERMLNIVIPPLALLCFAGSMAIAIVMVALSYALAALALYLAAILAIASVIAVGIFGKTRVESWLAGKGLNIRFPG